MNDKILVVGEIKDGMLRHVTFEAIAAAKVMNEDGKVIGILCGTGSLENHAQDMVHYGADEVIIVTNEQLQHYTSDGYSQAIMPIISEYEPSGIIFGHTAVGKDLAPKIASKLDSGLVSDVIDIECKDGDTVFTRPIYSGKAFEQKTITDGPLLITIRPNNMSQCTKDTNRQGEVIKREVDIINIQTVIKDVIQKSTQDIDISEANIVVAGGRGLKSADGFNMLYDLSDVLGGAVGASRGACDADYCDYSLQIGQTGKIITPDLYIAIGISGAIQHVAGMSNSKIIVAINQDPDAMIFNIADYGIVGDLFEVIPILIEEIKKVKEQ